ncbi:MAG: hypothetical protein ACR2OB_02405 [Solirubrobacteraceae bacterium]
MADRSAAGDRRGSAATAATPRPARPRGNMLPGREGRRFGAERILVRLIATCGIVGIGVLLAAILASSKTQGWIVGLVVALVSVILSAVLWSSRQL